MKKDFVNPSFKGCILLKILIMIKLTWILSIIFTLRLAANTDYLYSQITKIDLETDNMSLEGVIWEIKKKTEFDFFYSTEDIANINDISLSLKNVTVDEILTEALKKTDLTFNVVNKAVIIKKDEKRRLLKAKNISKLVVLQPKITIKGKVTDTEGNPLPGVNIIEKGTTNGAVTNLDGEYSFSVGSSDAILSFSYVGFLTEEVEVAGKTMIDLTMIEDIQSLEEVVVIGYTATSRKNLASAISAISDEDITGLVTSDVRQNLQGKVAGVQVINRSGDPGSGADVIIRGVGTFTSFSPLYVIDGIQGGDINSVQPQDIESITVLKDASTTAIYGSAAANGVVVITTKSGKKGDLKVSYEGSMGLASFSKRLDMLNASEYVDLVEDIQTRNSDVLSPKLMTSDVRVDRTDWQEAIFRNTLYTDHNLRLSGGTESVNYAISTGYQNHESVITDRNYQRFTFGTKMEEKLLNNRINLVQHLRVKNEITEGLLANFVDALRMPPYLEIYDPNNLGGFSRTVKVEDLNDANNPYNSIYNKDREARDLNIDFDLSAEVKLLEDLRFKSQCRLTGSNYHYYEWMYPNAGGNSIKESASMDEQYTLQYTMLLENFFTYNRSFNNHQLSLLAGNSYAPSRVRRSISVGGSEYTSVEIKNVALANSSAINGASVNSGKARLSYFGQLGYTFKDRYVLNASMRKDASSVFGINNRWGTFYGLGTAWIISEESFMKSVNAISNLKLRASYGKTGNDNIEPFLTMATVWKGESNNIVYSFGDGTDFSNGSTINSAPNKDLKWEETTQFDVGVDIGLFANRLNFVIDYYNRSNDDLLIETKIPNSTGLGVPGLDATQVVNAASMKNTGFEFAMSFTNNTKAFKWNISLNTTYSTNEVYALGTVGDIPIMGGSLEVTGDAITRTDIGHPLASFYGYVIDHVAVDQAEVDALNAQAVEASGGAVTEYKAGLIPGDFIWKDTDGNGYIDDNDRTYIGNPSPTWQYGGIFNASYKNFDFQMQFHGIADVDVVNSGDAWLKGMSRPFNSKTDVLRRWKQEGDVTDVPAPCDHPTSNITMSDWYVEKGDYLRVKNITLGYTLPETIFNGVIKKLRVYAAAQNLLTLTGYSGYDPEIYGSVFSRGIDAFQRPNPSIYRFGIQVNF